LVSAIVGFSTRENFYQIRRYEVDGEIAENF